MFDHADRHRYLVFGHAGAHHLLVHSPGRATLAIEASGIVVHLLRRAHTDFDAGMVEKE